MGASIGFSWTPNDILENNLFGVDINEEAVEIARLSLWLRTAQKGRKLSNLSSNIKCGNSLIDDATVAGDKDFNWKDEFKEVFDEGGFDVVIGNPPYLRGQGLKEHFNNETLFYEKNYLSSTGNYDLYLFIERSYLLVKNKSVASLILPHKFLISEFGKGICAFLLEKKYIESIVHFGSELIFRDATTYTCILKLTKTINAQIGIRKGSSEMLNSPKAFALISYSELLENETWNIAGEEIGAVLKRLKRQPKIAKDYFEKIFSGIQTSGDNVYLIRGKRINDLIVGSPKGSDDKIQIESGIVKPIVKGDDISKYLPLENRYFVIFPYTVVENKAHPMSEDFIKNNYPLAYNYLKKK